MLIFITILAIIATIAIFASLFLSDDLNVFQVASAAVALASCFTIIAIVSALDRKVIKVYNRNEQVDIDVVKHSNQFILIDSVTAISKYDSTFYKKKDNHFKRIE